MCQNMAFYTLTAWQERKTQVWITQEAEHVGYKEKYSTEHSHRGPMHIHTGVPAEVTGEPAQDEDS